MSKSFKFEKMKKDEKKVKSIEIGGDKVEYYDKERNLETIGGIKVHPQEAGREFNTRPSETVQGGAMTLRELYERSLSGNLPAVLKKHEYLDVETLEEIGEEYSPINDLTDLDKLRSRKEAAEKQLVAYEKAIEEKEKEEKIRESERRS
jgi:hypothetical protein